MNTKLQNFLDDADNVLSNDDIDCLIISDSNTTGLSGVKNLRMNALNGGH